MKKIYYCEGCENGKLFNVIQTEDSIIDWDDVVKTTKEENDRTIREIMTLPKIKICKQILNMKLFVLTLFFVLMLFFHIFVYSKISNVWIESGFFISAIIMMFISYLIIGYYWTNKQTRQLKSYQSYIKTGKYDNSYINPLYKDDK